MADETVRCWWRSLGLTVYGIFAPFYLVRLFRNYRRWSEDAVE